MHRALLLINPRSRRGRAVRAEAALLLKQAGFRTIAPSEADPENFSEIIERFSSSIDFVIVGGGDGTIRTVVPAMRQIEKPLAILPLGTANNLAKNLRIPTDLEGACAVIRTGVVKQIDLGSVNGELFLNVAGLGLSTEINRGVPGDLKRLWGAAAYGIYGLKLLRRMKPFKATVLVDGRELSLRSLQITVCNGRHFGAGMTISPDATISDAFLDLSSTDLKSLWQVVPLVIAMRRGEQKRLSNVTILRSSAFEIRTSKRIWIDTDGEVTTRTPAKFSVIPQALQVLAPAGFPVAD